MNSRLDRIIEIQRRTVTRDSYGGEIEGWEELTTTWARVNQTGADEAFRNEASRERATRDARMTIRHREDLDETMRVIYDELAWDIRGISEIDYGRHQELLVQADVGAQRFPFTGFTVMGGLSADAVPEASEITIAQVGHSIPLPAHVDLHHLIWRLASEPDLNSVVLASDTTNANQIGGYSLYADTVTLADGREGKVLVSNQLLTHMAERLLLS